MTSTERDPDDPKAAVRLPVRALVLRIALSFVLATAFVVALSPYLETIPADLSLPRWVIPAYLLALVPFHVLRGARWYALVRPLGDARLGETTLVSLAGYLWIAVLPFRLGELSRPLFLAERRNIPVQASLATVALERVVDGLVVCGLFFAGMAGRHALAHGGLHTAATVVMAGFGVALVVLAGMAAFPDATGRGLARVAAPVSPGLARTTAAIVTGVARGLAALPSPRALAWFLLTTLAYWLWNGFGMWILARGCDLPLSFRDAITVLAVMNITLMVPGGPAQLGVFQTGVALGLGLFLPAAVVHDRGSVFAFYLYVCQLSTIALVGAVAQWRLRLDWRAVVRPRGTGTA